MPLPADHQHTPATTELAHYWQLVEKGTIKHDKKRTEEEMVSLANRHASEHHQAARHPRRHPLSCPYLLTTHLPATTGLAHYWQLVEKGTIKHDKKRTEEEMVSLANKEARRQGGMCTPHLACALSHALTC